MKLISVTLVLGLVLGGCAREKGAPQEKVTINATDVAAGALSDEVALAHRLEGRTVIVYGSVLEKRLDGDATSVLLREGSVTLYNIPLEVGAELQFNREIAAECELLSIKQGKVYFKNCGTVHLR